jgi:hypothetical protein
VAKIFKEAIENGLILPTSKRPAEMEKYSDSNYCPYHRVLGHPIKDCWVFKDWVEKRYTEEIIKLPQSPTPHEAKEQEESVRFRVCTISNDMEDEDSDDGIVFNLKSIKTHLPGSGTRKEEKPKGVGSDQNPLKKFKKRNLKKNASLESYIECQNKR